MLAVQDLEVFQKNEDADRRIQILGVEISKEKTEAEHASYCKCTNLFSDIIFRQCRISASCANHETH